MRALSIGPKQCWKVVLLVAHKHLEDAEDWVIDKLGHMDPVSVRKGGLEIQGSSQKEEGGMIQT